MNGTIGVVLVTVVGAVIISGMGMVSVRADRTRRSKLTKSVKPPNVVTAKRDDLSAVKMAAGGIGNVNGNEGSNLAATGGTTR